MTDQNSESHDEEENEKQNEDTQYGGGAEETDAVEQTELREGKTKSPEEDDEDDEDEGK